MRRAINGLCGLLLLWPVAVTAPEEPCYLDAEIGCRVEGRNCGLISDNCDGFIECGVCDTPCTDDWKLGGCNSCGTVCARSSDCVTKGVGTKCIGISRRTGLGLCQENFHICTCVPATCGYLGATCGTIDNDCGGTLECGECGQHVGQACNGTLQTPGTNTTVAVYVSNTTSCIVCPNGTQPDNNTGVCRACPNGHAGILGFCSACVNETVGPQVVPQHMWPAVTFRDCVNSTQQECCPGCNTTRCECRPSSCAAVSWMGEMIPRNHSSQSSAVLNYTFYELPSCGASPTAQEITRN
jgi:hypothetical protein